VIQIFIQSKSTTEQGIKILQQTFFFSFMLKISVKKEINDEWKYLFSHLIKHFPEQNI